MATATRCRRLTLWCCFQRFSRNLQMEPLLRIWISAAFGLAMLPRMVDRNAYRQDLLGRRRFNTPAMM